MSRQQQQCHLCYSLFVEKPSFTETYWECPNQRAHDAAKKADEPASNDWSDVHVPGESRRVLTASAALGAGYGGWHNDHHEHEREYLAPGVDVRENHLERHGRIFDFHESGTIGKLRIESISLVKSNGYEMIVCDFEHRIMSDEDEIGIYAKVANYAIQEQHLMKSFEALHKSCDPYDKLRDQPFSVLCNNWVSSFKAELRPESCAVGDLYMSPKGLAYVLNKDRVWKKLYDQE